MKVISLDPLTATMAAFGYSSIVTRAPDTSHRGWVALHASYSMARETAELVNIFPTPKLLDRIVSTVKDRGWEPWPLPRDNDDGLIVGVAYLAKTENALKAYMKWNRREDAECLTQPEYTDVPKWQPSYGDFSKKNRAYWLCHPVPLAKPLRTRGFATSLWDTFDAYQRDTSDITSDMYEAYISKVLDEQGDPLPHFEEPAFWRTIQRRGEADAARPVNL